VPKIWEGKTKDRRGNDKEAAGKKRLGGASVATTVYSKVSLLLGFKIPHEDLG